MTFAIHTAVVFIKHKNGKHFTWFQDDIRPYESTIENVWNNLNGDSLPEKRALYFPFPKKEIQPRQIKFSTWSVFKTIYLVPEKTPFESLE